jgi:hypothetical protein
MTNRISYALGVLLHGVPEPVKAEEAPPPKEVTLLGTPEPVQLYVVEEYSHAGYGGYWRVVARYHTCEQAHAENPGRRVTARTFWRVGTTYISDLKVEVIHIQPKPKRPKGREKGA